MSDPRLNGDHLRTRLFRYGEAVEELIERRGPATAEVDPLVRLPRLPRAPEVAESPPPGGTYLLVNLDHGSQHQLRVGINAIGRYDENDLVLKDDAISRRHCIITVHATGGCELYDTASRNGTCVNGRKVRHTDLLPGDVIQICGLRFLVAWVGLGGRASCN